MRNLYKIQFIFLVLFSLIQSVTAQKSWGKNWTEWSKDDCIGILNKSPWAVTQQNTEVQNQLEQNLEQQRARGIVREEARPGQLPSVVVRLYSSDTIRKALVRLSQIQSNYEKMNETEKKEFDRQKQNTLYCQKCEQFYIVTLFLVSSNGQSSGSPNFLRFSEFNDLKKIVYLSNEKGEKRELSEFVKPQKQTDPIVFLFSKNNEKGEPLLKSETKRLKIRLEHGNHAEWKMIIPKDITFEVKQIMINGEVDF